MIRRVVDVRRRGALRAAGIGAMLLFGAAAHAAPAPIFQGAPTYAFAGSFQDALPILAVADVGSPATSASAGAPDGIPDLITANQNQQVLVLLGDGHGAFTTTNRISTALTTIPTALAAAKFDNDDFVDLLVADSNDEVVFLGGKSTGPPFAPPGSAIAAGNGPVAIAAGRLNNDQNTDAVVVDDGGATCGAGGVTVLLGDGHGAFTSGSCAVGGALCGTDADCGANAPCNAKMIPAGVGSSAVALWDVNGDGIVDYLAVTNACANTVSVLQGDGAGGFALIGTYSVGDSPVAIVAADLRGNGKTDLIVVNSNSDNIAVLDGLAPGTFNTAARFFPSGGDKSAPNSLALADFSGHGAIDVVVSNNFTFDVSVLRGDGKGNFSAPRAFVADQEPLAVTTGLFDNDNIPDVVTVNVGSQSETAAVLLGRSDGTLVGVENVIPPQPTTAATAGDADNDGVSDLIATDTNHEVLIYHADAAGGFAMPPEVLQSAGDTTTVGRGDFNGDGILDIVAVNQSTMNMSVFLGRAQGGFAARQDYTTGAAVSALAVGDWNGDGLSDVAVTFQAHQCSVTTTTACSSNMGCPQGQTCVGAVGVLLAQSDGRLGALATFAVGLRPVALESGDFNKDGKLDLVVANSLSNDLSILLGNGSGTFQSAPNVASGGTPLALAVADFDRDGVDDIAVAGSVSRRVDIFYGNGAGGFSPGQPLSVGDQNPASLAARDVTGDSIPDLFVMAGGETNSGLVFVGNGTARTFQQAQSIGLSRGPNNAVAADFTGSGRYDVAGSCSLVSCLPVLTNIYAGVPPVLRGDANGDGIVSAADAVAVVRELGDGNGTRIEQVQGGNYAAAPGVDANGDGLVTRQDALAVAHRLFAGS